jgi:hypothetical protein
MARLSALLVLLGLLSTNVLAAYNETLQNINADCDVSIFMIQSTEIPSIGPQRAQ